MYNLKIDEDFKRLIPPLSAEEYRQLEENIIRDGCREPLTVWYTTILDGHNRYEICTRLQIPFSIKRIFPKNREEAIAWICTNQLGRRNITDETRRYLIGKRYEMEKIIGAHNAAGINQHSKKEVRSRILTEPKFEDTAYRTREKLGEEYRISDGTVYKYGIYAHAIDSLSQVSPELVPKILSGEVKISHENLVDLSRLSDQTAKRLGQLLTEDEDKFIGNLRNIVPKRPRSQNKPSLPVSPVSVKDMPAYDPDAEISGLALTIPSWVSSINRARSATDLYKTTGDARCKLEKELLGLKEMIDSMLAAMKEVI